MARVSAAAGQMETAERLYQRLLEIDPESVSARMGLGDLAIDRRNPAEAMRWYEEALERAEGAARSRALLAHGRAALAAGRIGTAREHLTRFIASEPPPPDAQMAWGLNGLALIALFEEDPGEAVLLFEQAAVLAPDQARIKENLDRARAVLASRPPDPPPPPPSDTARPGAAPPATEGEDPGATAAPAPAAPEVPEPGTSVPALAEPGATPPGAAASPPAGLEVPAAVATAALPSGDPPREPGAGEPVAAVPAAAPEDPEPGTSAPAPAEPGATPPVTGAAAEAQSGVTPPAASAAAESETAPPATGAPEAVEPVPAAPGPKVPEKASDREIAALLREAGAFLVREGEDWFLQVAAFAKPGRAERMAARVRGRSGFPVKIVAAERSAGPLYLVRAGPVRSRRELRAVLDALGPGDGPAP